MRYLKKFNESKVVKEDKFEKIEDLFQLIIDKWNLVESNLNLDVYPTTLLYNLGYIRDNFVNISIEYCSNFNRLSELILDFENFRDRLSRLNYNIFLSEINNGESFEYGSDDDEYGNYVFYCMNLIIKI